MMRELGHHVPDNVNLPCFPVGEGLRSHEGA